VFIRKLKAALLGAVVWAAAVAGADAQAITIRAGELLDGKGGVAHNVTLTVEGSKIVKLQPGFTGPVTYDFGKMTVLPGLMDTHVHIGAHFGKDGKASNGKGESPAETAMYTAENAYVALMGGFTTIQSIGADTDIPVRDAINRGRLAGPRLLTSGNPLTDSTSLDKTPDEIRAQVRAQAAKRVDLIKLIVTRSIRDGGDQTWSNEQLAAACDEANKLGMLTWVHAHADAAVRNASLSNCHTVTHGQLVTDDTLRLLAKRGTWMEPTFGLVQPNYMKNMDRYLGTGNYTPEAFAYMRGNVELNKTKWRRFIAIPGLKIINGSDATSGAEGFNAEEIIWRVENGQKPMDAIVNATSRTAEAVRLDKLIGSIAPGMEADLIAVVDDPLTKIRTLERVVFVMKGGRVYKNEAPSDLANILTREPQAPKPKVAG
jgi:imidazolonepropionase-like amidohydrolase